MSRFVAMLLAIIMAVNGVVMLLAPLWWYGVVPGVPATGAYNPHFVRDIGAAYLTGGACLAAFARTPVQAWPAAVAAALFLTLHAAIHVFDATCSANGWADALRDLPGVYLPALASVWIVVLHRPSREIFHAQRPA